MRDLAVPRPCDVGVLFITTFIFHSKEKKGCWGKKEGHDLIVTVIKSHNKYTK